MDLSFVFPCLNEEETLAHCIDELKRSLDAAGIAYEIIVVDNGSQDRSAEIAQECGARVVNESCKGYGAALSSGIRHASGTYVAFADADGRYPLDKIGEMYRLAEESGADMVIASRFRGIIEPGAMPASHRYLGTPVLTTLINLIYRGQLSDCNSGFRLLRKSACESWGVRSDGMEFASELLIKALKNRAAIAELPGGLRKDLRSRPPHLKTWRDGMRHLLYILSEAPGLFEKVGLFLVFLGAAIQISCFCTGIVTLGEMAIGGIHNQAFRVNFRNTWCANLSAGLFFDRGITKRTLHALYANADQHAGRPAFFPALRAWRGSNRRAWLYCSVMGIESLLKFGYVRFVTAADSFCQYPPSELHV